MELAFLPVPQTRCVRARRRRIGGKQCRPRQADRRGRHPSRTGAVALPVVVCLRDRSVRPHLAAQSLSEEHRIMSALLWFRRDLRLCDHPALASASDAAENQEVLACFVLDPRLEASSGRRRLQFLGDSLRQLRDDLGGRLLVTRGRPEDQIPNIAKEVSASSVHISEDFAPFGRRRDERVRAALGSVPLVATGSPYLVSPGRVTKKDGSAYKVFTPFLRAWRETGWRKPAQSGADSARWLDPGQLSVTPCKIPDPGPAL